MTEPQQHTIHADDDATLVVGGEETTLVSPRFDDEETQVARPVVPLDADAEAAAAQDLPAARPAHVRRSPYGPRRSWMLALVLVSVLIGGVLGGAGLYLYQRQSDDPAVSPAATTQQPEPPADSAQQAPPDAEGQTVTPADASAQKAETQAPGGESDAEEQAPPARVERVEEAPAARPAREPETVPATERREAPAAGGTGTPKRGKQGDRDEEIERRAAPRPAGNVVRAEEPEARQVDTIFYRQRRAERRAERRAARRARRDDDADRLRRIFEGTP